MKIFAWLAVSSLFGAAMAGGGEASPLMVRPGAALLDDSFGGRLNTGVWAVAIGAWEVADGALSGAERPDDHHAAVVRTPFAGTTAVVQFSFMLQGDSGLHFSVNDPDGHNFRLAIRTNSVTLRKDADKKDPRSFSPVLDEAGASLAPDAWHTMIVEIAGPEVLARVDGALFLYGAHPGLDRPKKDFGFPVTGAARIDDVKVWDAAPSPGWPAEKAKLLARRADRPAVDRAGNPQEAFQAAEAKARERLLTSDPAFVALVDARAKAQEALAKAHPVVNRRGPKADEEKKRLAGGDAGYQKLAADLRRAQKSERDHLLAADADARRAAEALAADHKAKAAAK